nr:MAG TPA: hypothetical protein [Caudoviricetes sp.]
MCQHFLTKKLIFFHAHIILKVDSSIYNEVIT